MYDDLIGFEELLWDSKFFGFPVARLDLRTYAGSVPIEKLRQSKARLVYIIADHADESANQIASMIAGEPKDCKVDFMKSSKIVNELAMPANVHLIDEVIMAEDRECLEKLALESGTYSRFLTDPQIDRKKGMMLYKIWLENSLTGLIADRVFVARTNDRISGFATLAFSAGKARIGLIAVDSVLRGAGIGRQLIHASASEVAKRGAHTIMVATQAANLAACAFYTRIGFQVAEQTNIYHFWNGHDD